MSEVSVASVVVIGLSHAHGVGTGAYTGLFALPSTSVVREGDLLLGYSSGVQVRRVERGRGFDPRDDNYAVVLGLLPNLEVGMSSLVAAPFNGMLDDRSVAVKWRPIGSPSSRFSLAFGATDVQGTRLRPTDYAVASIRWGSATFTGGLGRGVFSGAMGGLEVDVLRNVLVGVESVGSEITVGAKAHVGDRVWLGAALGPDRRPFVSASYAIPLSTPLPMPCDTTQGIEDLDALRRRIEGLTNGGARTQVVDSVLVVSYEDVEARDPVVLFGQVLDLCTSYAGKTLPDLSVTVRHLGRDLVTLRGKTRVIATFLRGWMGAKEFLREVGIEDEGPALAEATGEALIAAPTLVTIEPGIDYRLGLKDRLPNKEWLRAREFQPLPLGLVGAATQDWVLNEAAGTRGATPGPSIGLFRLDRFGSFWSAVGLEHRAGEEWFASAQVVYYRSRPDLRLLGTYGRTLVANSTEPDRYAVEAGLDGISGTASLWARHERFEVGDTGETLGLTRRFGRTEVAVTWSSSRECAESVRRAGITFRVPLPEARVPIGSVHVATAAQAELTYRPAEHAEPSMGWGIPRRATFSIHEDLTARGRLSAQMFRAQVDRMRRPGSSRPM